MLHRIFVTSAIFLGFLSAQATEKALTTLAGNTRPEATKENDRGRVSDDYPMPHLLLQLRRTAQKQTELERFVTELHDPSSPNFHRWLTADQIGERFGPSQELPVVRAWLETQGFTVNVVFPSKMTIDFSGTAAQVRKAFHTEIHRLVVTGDWYAFRRIFGLTKRYPSGTFAQIHPSGAFACTDPGPTTGANREATLDSEWASAAAPNANIVLASCADGFDWGYFIAMRNLLNSPNPPTVMSLSYGGSEAGILATENESVYSLYLQAAAEGVSMFVSGGDWGADAYRPDRGLASQRGMSVNGFASTPYNVAVGGTDFEDVYLGQTDMYWNPTNTVTWDSAKSYVPEIAWNGSCASQLVSIFNGFPDVFGSGSFCNSPSVPSNLLTGLAGGGGPSSCAFGRPTVTGL